MKKLLKRLTQVQLVALSFFTVIAIGTFLLTLPISSRAGAWTSPVDALFTATSATCVTGLVVFDTATYWTLFGQIVILCLIQVGGLGCMTLLTLIAMFLRKKISLYSRKVLMQSAGTLSLSGVVRLVKQVAIGTACFELAGAALLSTQFIPCFGWKYGIYASIFHSVSAFCNAGFDVCGVISPGSSLTYFAANPVVNLTIAGLIVIGGIGFLVWNDLLYCKWHIRRWQLHTKLVVTVTLLLIFGGWGLFYLFERNAAFRGMPFGEKLLAALFQSVTPRTAGFNTVPMSRLSESGSVLTTVLMFIGGSPGSTAGGIKTTTVAVLFMSAVSSARRHNDVDAFRQRLDDGTVRDAASIFAVYLMLVIFSTLTLCAIEPFSLKDVIFEVVSAIGTVGLSMGITSSLCTASKIILSILMYAGRIGGLSFVLILSERRRQAPLSRPLGKILIG